MIHLSLGRTAGRSPRRKVTSPRRTDRQTRAINPLPGVVSRSFYQTAPRRRQPLPRVLPTARIFRQHRTGGRVESPLKAAFSRQDGGKVPPQFGLLIRGLEVRVLQGALPKPLRRNELRKGFLLLGSENRPDFPSFSDKWAGFSDKFSDGSRSSHPAPSSR